MRKTDIEAISITLPAIIIDKVSTSSLKDCQKQYAYIILSILQSKALYIKGKENRFIPLAQSYWNKVMTCHHPNPIKRVLYELNILEVFNTSTSKNGSYSLSTTGYKKTYCKAYRINPEIYKQEELSTKKVIVKVKKEIHNLITQELAGQINTHLVNLDFKTVNKFSIGISNKHTLVRKTWLESQITNKNFRISRNRTNKRLDSIGTQLSKEELGQLTFYGEEIAEVDIINCQPNLFINNLKEFAVDNFHLTEEEDFKRFVYLTHKGELYDFLGTYGRMVTRDIAKNKLMKWFFGSKIHEEFEAIFPSVHEYIHTYKKHKKSHKKFSIKLQKLESKLFIDKLLPVLHKKGFRVIPRHDSFLCPKSEVEQINQVVVGFLVKEKLIMKTRVKSF